MHFEILVEEASIEAALRKLLPKILRDLASFNLVVHAGKPDLLKRLPARLRGYRAWMPENYRIVVLIDEDREDCKKLKEKLEEEAQQAGFSTVSNPGHRGGFEVLNRIAVEELEAWFFGDVEALREVYPRVPATLENKAPFRDPDAIQGGTWEALERVLKRAGYFPAGMPKIEVARSVAEHMEPGRNRSHSFAVFRSGLETLLSR